MATQSQSPFHAYDIRGLSPQELDEAFAGRLGLALVRQFSPRRVLVGRDARTTSPALEKALVDALLANGVDVTRIGLCSTPMFNVSVVLSSGAYDLGVMVTASHNPGKYNGFKIVRGDALPVGQGSGMEELEAAYNATEGMEKGSEKRRGSLTEDPKALSRYIDHVVKLAALPPDMPKIKVAIDAGNGMAGAVLPELISRLSWLDVKPLYFEPDCSFPNHEANPLKTETLKDLSRLVKKEGCAFGVAFDGDADRIGFVDENGEPIPGDLGTAMLAQEVLRMSPGATILYDIRSSWTVPEVIREAGGKPEMCRVGHAFIKQQIKETGAELGGEISMHYYFRSINGVESGDLVLLLLLKRLIREQSSMSGVFAPLRRYVHSGEMNFTVLDPSAVIQRISEAYRDTATTVSELDGIRMEFRDANHPENDWWFNVRKSNTEPLVRLNLETRSASLTKAKVKELHDRIL